MIPVEQTILHDPDKGLIGNCLQACIASILNKSIDQVPHFVARKKADWFDVMNDWLLQNAGVEAMMISEDSNIAPSGYAILNGKSPRGSMHSVVILNGELAHDPHPAGGGIIEPTSYTIFVSPMK